MKVAIHVPTRDDYNILMEYFESKGIEWSGGGKATEFEEWVVNEERCVAIHDRGLGYGYRQDYRRSGYSIVSVESCIELNIY